MSSSEKWTKDNISFPDSPIEGEVVDPTKIKLKTLDKLMEHVRKDCTEQFGQVELLSEGHFRSILDGVINQVFQGKGKERHGHTKPLSDQPWRHITDNVGKGFVLGQAMKKLMELRSFKDLEAWKREALGAIVYIVFAIMFAEKEGKV